MLSLKDLTKNLDHFFFAAIDLRILGVVRIMFAFTLMINMLMLAPDLLTFFGTEGLVDVAAGRGTVDPDVLSIFDVLPQKDWVVQVVYALMLYSIAAIGIGFWSQLHALVTFVIYTSFIHRNVMIFDGEDVVFRMFCFFLIFAPAGKFYSIMNLIRGLFGSPRAGADILGPAWPLRLFQIQMTLIYFSTAWEKMKGPEWLSGTAMYYIYRLEEFVRFPIPEFIYSDIRAIKLLTWSTVVVEALLPICLWFKETRRIAIPFGCGLHLAIEYQMNLNMFQWIMITGLISFVKWDEDLKFLQKLKWTVKQLVSRARLTLYKKLKQPQHKTEPPPPEFADR